MDIENLIKKSHDFIKINKFNKALEILEKIETQTDSRVYFLIGSIYLNLKKIDLAEKNLKFACKINNQNSLIFHNLAIVFSIKGEVQLAKENFLKAIEIKKDIESISELGRIFSNENNFEDAKKYFEMAIAIDKNHKKTNLRIGNMFMKINEHKKGLSYIQKATGFIRFTDNGVEIV